MSQEELQQLYELLLKADACLPENKNDAYKVEYHSDGFRLIGISYDYYDCAIHSILYPDGTKHIEKP